MENLTQEATELDTLKKSKTELMTTKVLFVNEICLVSPEMSDLKNSLLLA